jgi:hypothetical protein
MEGMGGLVELVLVFAFVLGFAVLELMSLRRYKKRKAAEDADAAAVPGRVEAANPESGSIRPDG